MYTQRIIHHPALEKNAGLWAALEERNNAANAAAPHSLGVSMFALEPAFIHAIRFENLAEIEAYQDQQQGDATFQAGTRKIAQCLSRPQGVLLFEEVARTGVPVSPKFLVRTMVCPAPGKVQELRGVFEERMKKGPPPGATAVVLSQQVASVDGPAFETTLLFASMAAIDEYRAATATGKDAGHQAFLNQVWSLLRTPPQQRMQRILIPFTA
jgi:hypothetical protein